MLRASSPARPALTTRAEFEAVWDGELVLMARMSRELFGGMSLPSRDVDY